MCNFLHLESLREAGCEMSYVRGSFQQMWWREARFSLIRLIAIVATASLAPVASGETCRSGADLDDATRSALTNAAMRDFDPVSYTHLTLPTILLV